MAELPNKTSQDLHLVVATSEENLAQTHANSEAWRGALNLESYVRRETHLSNQDLTRNGGLTAWMLVHQPDPNGPRQVLCGCETIKKKALIGKAGKVVDVVCHGVCSVFCPPKFRGKGYAGRMISELGSRLKSWQTESGEECLFSVLFSDIGKEFYSARGWQVFPSTHISLPPSSASPSNDVKLLNSEGLAELCKDDEKLIRKRLSQSKENEKSSVALLPDQRTLAWHHAKEEFVASELGSKPPAIKGAMVNVSPNLRAWCIWARVWGNPQEKDPNILHILRLVVESESFSDFAAATSERAAELESNEVSRAIASLFRAAQCQAAEWDMKHVWIWNPTSTTLAAAQSINQEVSVVDREHESITSLRWYGDGSWKDVEWICNEKFGWC